MVTLSDFASLYDLACKTKDKDNIEDAEALRNEAIERVRKFIDHVHTSYPSDNATDEYTRKRISEFVAK